MSSRLITPRNFTFGGCGWMLAYHLGVMFRLQEVGGINFEKGSNLACASGGAVVGACFASDCSEESMLKMIQYCCDTSREKGMTGWLTNIGPVITEALHDIIPSDGHQIVNGRLTVATRVISPKVNSGPVFHTKFKNKDHLIKTVIASSWIPGFTGKTLGMKLPVDGFIHNDGASTTITPDPDSYTRVSVQRTQLTRARDPIWQDCSLLKTYHAMAFPQSPESHVSSRQRGIDAVDRWVIEIS
eukprot:TRINITY_DN2330_c0_g1_i1.p1 TRINITY_DN2330_c0_g1~~TRINITY_DN2330_c0_g1_i1.p1  ORF type:complete len:266 (+),score=33.93 TRINITY_DN2330_c0_g1_i1:72-800(+)